MSDTDKEESVHCAQVVVYQVDSETQMKWCPKGDGQWAELHVFRDPRGKYRVVAWILTTQEVVINARLRSSTELALTADDFAEFENRGEKKLGLFFASPVAAKETKHFLEGVVTELQEAKAAYKAAKAAKARTAVEKAPLEVQPQEAAPEDESIPPPTPVRRESRRQSLACFEGVENAVEEGVHSGDFGAAIEQEKKRMRNRSNLSALVTDVVAAEFSDEMANLESFEVPPGREAVDPDATPAPETSEPSEAVAPEAVSSEAQAAEPAPPQPNGFTPPPLLSKMSKRTMSQRSEDLNVGKEKEVVEPQQELAPPMMLSAMGSPRSAARQRPEESPVRERPVMSFEQPTEKGKGDVQNLSSPAEPQGRTNGASRIIELNSGEVDAAGTFSGDIEPLSPVSVVDSPRDVHHEVHVTYNYELARYEGLPSEWQSMNQQFGVAYQHLPKVEQGFNSKIPAVLVMLKRELLEGSGVQVEGIFRLAPDKNACNDVKERINTGCFETGEVEDVNVFANLIKVWFRELPTSLLDVLNDTTIIRIAETPVDNVAAEMEENFPEPMRSLFYWLLDLMAEVVINEDKNRMTAKNMAIVISPNLFSVSEDNPMFALTMSKKISDFTEVCLKSWLKTKRGYGDYA